MAASNSICWRQLLLSRPQRASSGLGPNFLVKDALKPVLIICYSYNMASYAGEVQAEKQEKYPLNI
jgi:hypothetical protein